MLKEIFEQPTVIKETLSRPDRRKRARASRARARRDHARTARAASARSRSPAAAPPTTQAWSACICCARWCGCRSRWSSPSEFRYGDPVIDPTTLVIAMSQSGETADTDRSRADRQVGRLRRAGHLQRARFASDAARRRHALYARRPGDRRCGDQNLRLASRRHDALRALSRASPRHAPERQAYARSPTARSCFRRPSTSCSTRPIEIRSGGARSFAKRTACSSSDVTSTFRPRWKARSS